MSSRTALPRTCRVEADVPAPVDEVWRVVSDVTRTGEWSHECHEVDWLGGATCAAPGARFRGANRSAWLRWNRTCVVTELAPGRSITWQTLPTWRFVDSTEWRITLERLDDHHTRIVQTYEVLRCPRWWEWLVARVNPPHRDRSAALAADLARIGGVIRP
jgi:polyketide cyclase/dehydrase/lipid transport protein